ncbi:MAG: DUF3106 domain-containing protein [Leptothrix sp. (in: b-proteobacteria)]
MSTLLRWADLGALTSTGLLALLLSAGTAHAQALGTASWDELSASEQRILQPLQAQWASTDAPRRQKWRDIASRFPTMNADQQARTTSRMAEWAAMTPNERNAARLQFEQVKQLPSSERQARWDAYQALAPEQRDALSKQAATRAPIKDVIATKPAAGSTPTKSNIVEANRPSAKPLPVGPATVQAGVGASTKPITQRPTPPRHQQAGLPKIAATPDFVDRTTLLPQRGPQGAAVETPRNPAP